MIFNIKLMASFIIMPVISLFILPVQTHAGSNINNDYNSSAVRIDNGHIISDVKINNNNHYDYDKVDKKCGLIPERRCHHNTLILQMTGFQIGLLNTIHLIWFHIMSIQMQEKVVPVLLPIQQEKKVL